MKAKTEPPPTRDRREGSRSLPAPPDSQTTGARHRFKLPQAEVQANHKALIERNAVLRRNGYDAESAVRFVLEQALPLRGRILDVGTGKGRFAIALARHVRQITTVDVNPREQRFARLEAAYAGVSDRIFFAIHDARALPWPAASFDAVVSWNVVHHLDDPARVFAEMLRVLKPGGKLVLADLSPAGFRAMDRVHRAEGRRHPHPPSTFPHWAARLRKEGFAVQKFTRQHQEVLIARAPRLKGESGFPWQPPLTGFLRKSARKKGSP
jgi:ubiquinone/menaquinone biosynthesis C-methylase UbiE